MPRIVVVAVLLATAGCGGLNTRIGFPSLYWGHGVLVFAGYVAVVLTFGAAVFVMLDWVIQDPPDDKSDDQFKAIQKENAGLVCILFVAGGALLQALPRADKGLQVVPVVPWAFPAGFAFLTAVLSWAGVAACAAVLVFKRRRMMPVFSRLGLMTMLLTAALSPWSFKSTDTGLARGDGGRSSGSSAPAAPDTPSGPPAAGQIGELRANITRWTEQRGKLARLIGDLEHDRDDLLAKLDRMGVRTPGAASDDPKAKVLLDELREVLAHLTQTGKKQAEYDLAILKSESRLRSVERQVAGQDAGMTDQEVRDLLRAVVALDDALARDGETAVPAELDETLAKALADGRRSRPIPGDRRPAAEPEPAPGPTAPPPAGLPRGDVVMGNVALAAKGATADGPYRAVETLLDGKTNDREYAKAALGQPCVVTFPSVYRLQLVRFKLPDVGTRYYRYWLEVSADGRSFETVADRTAGEWRGWQEVRFAVRPVKAVRLTGTFNSETTGLHVVEFEAYCDPADVPR